MSFGALPTSVDTHIRISLVFMMQTILCQGRQVFLCSDASLPGSNLATADVKGDFMGVPQEFAHTRLYADIDFTFYVDNDYNNLQNF